jgi:hypothetical protein
MNMDLRDLYRSKGAEALRTAPAHEWHPPASTALGQSITSATPTAGGKRKILYRHCDDVEASLQSRDLVHRLLIHGDVSVVYGASNVGKSFWVLDLASSIANGAPFRGKARVDGGAVVYVSLEGRHSFANRISALKITGRLNPGAPLYIVNSTFNLLDAEDCDALIESVKDIVGAAKAPVRMIVIDTLARAIAGGDENSSADMTSAVRAVDEIKNITGAHVMLIHHPGKNEAKGARGHSSLRAAIDTEIEISKSGGSSLACAIVTKQRDLPAIPPMLFELKSVDLGFDNYGGMVTSCVVHHDFDSTLSPAVKKTEGQSQNALLKEQVLELLPETAAVHKAQFLDLVERELGATDRAAKSVIREMVNEDLLFECRVPSKSGQKLLHLTRKPPDRGTTQAATEV